MAGLHGAGPHGAGRDGGLGRRAGLGPGLGEDGAGRKGDGGGEGQEKSGDHDIDTTRDLRPRLWPGTGGAGSRTRIQTQVRLDNRAHGRMIKFGVLNEGFAPVTVSFDDLDVGQVLTLGAVAIDRRALESFCSVFAPEWNLDDGAPDAMVYAIWSRLESETSKDWLQTKRLAVDALRWVRNPPVGELLRGRMTVLGKDPVGEGKGILIAQHDLLDEAGRLVFSCLTRSVFAR
jgi:hypothetical protein